VQPADGRPPSDSADPLISATYAGWWVRGWTALRATWPRLLVLQLIGAAVNVAWTLTLLVLRRPGDVDGSSPGAGAQAAGAVLDIAVLAMVALAAVHLVILTAAGQQPTITECLFGALRRALPLIAWSVPAAVLIGVGLLVLVLPGLYFFLALSLLLPVVAVERRVGIGRCFDIFRSDAWSALARTGTILGLTLAVAAIGDALTPTRAGDSHGGLVAATSLSGSAIGSVVTIIVGLVTIPLTVTAYAALRARVEPLSTGHLAAQLVQP
jgi:hypothetical protein